MTEEKVLWGYGPSARPGWVGPSAVQWATAAVGPGAVRRESQQNKLKSEDKTQMREPRIAKLDRFCTYIVFLPIQFLVRGLPHTFWYKRSAKHNDRYKIQEGLSVLKAAVQN